MMTKDEYTKRLEEIMARHWAMCTGQRPIYEHYSTEEAITAILALNNEAIGETEIQVRGITQNKENPMYWTKGTKIDYELRQELREKVKKYCD